MKRCGFKFQSTYTELPELFFSTVNPNTVVAPEVVILNTSLARSMGLDFSGLNDEEQAAIFSGNELVEGSAPFAQAYAGHQFGHFTMLGDGRAHVLGEHLTPDGTRLDIQLKGSGRTPYSRGGDGKAALGPMLREYIISEAMHHLGIPTTRSLAVVSTGEMVMREGLLPGAILTRVASSHIRVGTFAFAAGHSDKFWISSILDYTINRHYPESANRTDKALALLEAVIRKQADLVTHWLRVGFIHGVMNTDNMTLSGETIDYGPCAFMDKYNPDTVFSSIDHTGRYAFANQPSITQWNLARLAETLLPLIDEDVNEAIKIAESKLKEFSNIFQSNWLAMYRTKLGLFGERPEDLELISDLLNWMQTNSADYTNTFRDLSQAELSAEQIYEEKGFRDWYDRWQSRLSQNGQEIEESIDLMKRTNPAVIPRNHQVEAALEAAGRGAYEKLHNLLAALENPYEDNESLRQFQTPPELSDRVYQTFCGT